MSRPVPGAGDVHGVAMLRITGDDAERFMREARRLLTRALNGRIELDGPAVVSIVQACDRVAYIMRDAERRAEIRAFNEGGGRR